MCTVSYIPFKKKFILTSNRDERVHRATIPPVVYHQGDVDICFPKDLQAGGSWIALNNKGRLSCLLNGGLVAHQKQSFHTYSRGKILIEMVSKEQNAREFFMKKDLSPVEPFTIITIDREGEEIKDFNEFIWDGIKKHFRILDKTKPFIWSSVTLYDEKIRKQRGKWFQQFLSDNPDQITPESVFSFHSGEHTSDSGNNLVMDRKQGLKTVSITQVFQNGKGPVMKYFDLNKNTFHEIRL